MVVPFFATARAPDFLSVLALSSRFDGRIALTPSPRLQSTFSTRSVESF